ncbi:hypothetical protein ACOBQX_04940 [Actinokineospora sp. G85]|uniref:hypothetical protein n=1 Tax=Actinokineospora sp. G85 TaxID=3406626 RepID=UPI003C714C40
MTAALGIIINVATDLKTNVWAWLAVVVLVVAGAAVGLGLEKRSRTPAAAAPDATDASDATTSQVNSGQHGVQVNVGGSSDRITVKSRSGTAGLTVGVLVIVATLAGLVAGAWLPRPGPGPVPAGGGGGAPAWTVSMGPDQCTTGWVVPDEGQSSIPVPEGPPPGAVLSSGGQVVVTLQGVREEAAVLQSISVEVVRRSSPLSGIYLPGLCGSDVTPHFYGTDLDAPRPRVVPMPGKQGGEVVPAQEFSFKVGKSDVEKVVVVPTSSSGYVEWYLHVEWTSGGERGDLRIDDGGKPFRTTSAAAAKRWCTTYVSHSVVWAAPDGGAQCD